MTIAMKLFSLFLVISFASQAFAECTLSDIRVNQTATGFSIHGKPEFEVVISNDCICSQSSLVVSCKGFQSTLAVDPSILQPEGDNCSINNGQPVFQGNAINFKYAWDSKFDLDPVSSQINCS